MKGEGKCTGQWLIGKLTGEAAGFPTPAAATLWTSGLAGHAATPAAGAEGRLSGARQRVTGNGDGGG